MKLDKEQIKRLQNLSAIQLSGEEEEMFFDKLGSIIDFLSQLKALNLSDISLDDVGVGHTMSAISGVQEFDDTKSLLVNVEHEVINNSVVVKSSLD